MWTSHILDFKDIFLQTKVCAQKARKSVLRYYDAVSDEEIGQPPNEGNAGFIEDDIELDDERGNNMCLS